MSEKPKKLSEEGCLDLEYLGLWAAVSGIEEMVGEMSKKQLYDVAALIASTAGAFALTRKLNGLDPAPEGWNQQIRGRYLEAEEEAEK